MIPPPAARCARREGYISRAHPHSLPRPAVPPTARPNPYQTNPYPARRSRIISTPLPVPFAVRLLSVTWPIDDAEERTARCSILRRLGDFLYPIDTMTIYVFFFPVELNKMSFQFNKIFVMCWIYWKLFPTPNKCSINIFFFFNIHLCGEKVKFYKLK